MKLVIAPFVLGLVALTACSSEDAADDDPGKASSSGGDGVNQCATPTGSGTAVSSPTASTTWTAEGSPYVVSGGLSIPEGVTLTLEPCTVVRLDPGVNVSVSGVLLAKGEQYKQVRFEPNEAGKPWGGIDSAGVKTRTIDLTYTTLSEGGTQADPAYYTLRVRGNPNDTPYVDAIRVDHVTVEKSASVGMEVYEGAGFSKDSTELTITGSGAVPLFVNAASLTELPTGSYSGNASDTIDVAPWGNVLTGKPGEALAVTMHDRGVPYRIGEQEGSSELVIGSDREGAAATTLTIEAGVTVRLRPNGIIRMLPVAAGETTTGSLVVQGTASQPVTFTSDAKNPAAGDWSGIWLEGGAPSSLSITGALIEYAGAPATTRGYSCGTPTGDGIDIENQGAVVIASEMPLGASFLHESTITNSAANGVDRGWSGGDVDFAATNQFSAIADCVQTQMKAQDGTCPAQPSCPKAS